MTGFGVVDLLLRGGEVIDGTGGPRFKADVAITGDLISGVFPPDSRVSSRQTLDIGGRVLAPGFIDSHSHDDRLVLEESESHPKLTQGVCTVVTGNCGISLAPYAGDRPPAPLDILGPADLQFVKFAEYLAAIDAAAPATNVVPLVGHIALRVRHVADLMRAATAIEAEAMRRELREALDAGAFGLSTGVYYPPARATSIDELHAVCEALQGRDAILAMHIRDEGDRVAEAVEEAVGVGARCGAKLVISHHKVMGLANHGRTTETLAIIDRAALTHPVCLDCYPYDASSTMLDASKAARIGNVLITWSKAAPEMGGRTLVSIAREWGMDLDEAAGRLMPGGAIYFSMSQTDVDRVLAHPATMIGSDGLPHDARPHPRLWGAFPRVLGHYSRERKLFPLEAAVHKMTGLTAARFGLARRGEIKAGYAADLVVFDPDRINDAATYDDPAAPAIGIDWVIVNGRAALRGGTVIDAHAGRRLLPASSQ